MSGESFADRVKQRLEAFTEALERGEQIPGAKIYKRNPLTGELEFDAEATQAWYEEDDDNWDFEDDDNGT